MFLKKIKAKANFLSNLKNKKKLTLTIAVNYGGQQEIFIAIKIFIRFLNHNES